MTSPPLRPFAEPPHVGRGALVVAVLALVGVAVLIAAALSH
jgi:hypothetical protein